MKKIICAMVLFLVASVMAPAVAEAQVCVWEKAGTDDYGNCEECDDYSIDVVMIDETGGEAGNEIAKMKTAAQRWTECAFSDGEDGPTIEEPWIINPNNQSHLAAYNNADIKVRFRNHPNPEELNGECATNNGEAGGDGATITIWANAETACDDLTNALHELGHALGLRDADTEPGANCGSVTRLMKEAQIPGQTFSWPTQAECNAVNDMWVNPVVPGEGEGPFSPLVLDLDDNGIATSSVEVDPVLFDLNNDGVLDMAGWTAARTRDAFLWLDLNGDGVPNNGAELFGTATVLPDGATASNGIEALAAYDSNGDRKITPEDAVWPRLMLWNDRNHNASLDGREGSALATSGVVGISLNAARRKWADENGNVHSHASVYWTRSGRAYQRHLIEDIWFAVLPVSDDRR